MKSLKIILCAGTRPNFMKIAPIYHEASKRGHNVKILHTGQHYDNQLSTIFFRQLRLPSPDINLEINGLDQTDLLKEIKNRSAKYIKQEDPNLVITVGDVNSTLGCTLGAKKADSLVAHVEAGLRSRDMRMPEETNRVKTDKLSDYKFVTEPDGIINLKNENLYTNTFLVGNFMIDSLVSNLDNIKATKLPKELNNFISNNEYAVVTLHRPSNVDDKNVLEEFLKLLIDLNQTTPILFSIHPRTLKKLKEFKLMNYLKDIYTTSPLGYFEFIKIVSNSKLVLTDSGGIQEETTYLKIPCITLRSNTERPITITKGSSYLAGEDIRLARYYAEYILKENNPIKGESIDLWDGNASKRLLDILEKEL